jgi:hypothetical protein
LKDIAPRNARPGTTDDIHASSGVVRDGCAVDVNKAAGCGLICLDASGIGANHAVMNITDGAVNLVYTNATFGDLDIIDV